MTEILPLTNRERIDNVVFLYERWTADGSPRGFCSVPPILEENQKPLEEIVYTALCYNALAAQPAPESVVTADWYHFLRDDIPGKIWHDEFSIVDYAIDPPVTRTDSKGKVLDFVRLKEFAQTWERLLPQPAEPEVTPDVLYAVSGGSLKSMSFAMIRDMLLTGRWVDPALYRYAHLPSAKARKRTVRMGLCDLPERADTFADMKAFSRASHAVTRVGHVPDIVFNEYILHNSAIRCELCDATRMAACPVPHCRWRRQHVDTSWSR